MNTLEVLCININRNNDYSLSDIFEMIVENYAKPSPKHRKNELIAEHLCKRAVLRYDDLIEIGRVKRSTGYKF